MKSLLLALSLAAAFSAAAVTIAPGDLAVSPFDPWAGIGELPHPRSYLLGSDGTEKGTLPNLWPIAVFGPNGHLFAVPITFSGEIEEYDSSLNLVRTIDPNVTIHAEALLVAPNGDFLVLDYYQHPAVLYVLTSDGELKSSFALPSTGSADVPAALDVATDGCTVLYTDRSHTGRRLDACTGTTLADLPGGPTDVVRALNGGGYVAVHGATLDFYDAEERHVRSLETPFQMPRDLDATSQITDLHFDSDPRFLWVAAVHAVYKIRIADGAVVLQAGQPPVTFSVNGEQRPTVAGVATSRRRIAPHASSR